MPRRQEPLHPIVERPWSYEVVGLNFQRGDPDQEPFVDVTLMRGDERRHLRFLSPHDIQIQGGLPTMSGGLVILDVSGRGMEGLAVMVEDFDAAQGSIRFFAREAIDLDAPLADDAEVDETDPMGTAPSSGSRQP